MFSLLFDLKRAASTAESTDIMLPEAGLLLLGLSSTLLHLYLVKAIVMSRQPRTLFDIGKLPNAGAGTPGT